MKYLAKILWRDIIFSKQRHRGGSNENPLARQVLYNASTLVQQRAIYKDLKNMNVEGENSTLVEKMDQPLAKKTAQGMI